MRELRFHGRGGQGVVKSAQIIVEAVVKDGKYAHFIPSFGVERKGSPVHGFLRLSDKNILSKAQVHKPEAVIIYDESLISLPATLDGLINGGLILVNTEKTLGELKEAYQNLDDYNNIYLVPATRIARETINRDIPNTTMLGAYAKVIGDVNFEILKSCIRDMFGEANVNAAQKGYDQVISGKGVIIG